MQIKYNSKLWNFKLLFAKHPWKTEEEMSDYLFLELAE